MIRSWPWMLFWLTAAVCVLWIGKKFYDDRSEFQSLRGVVVERLELFERAERESGEIWIGAAGDWKRRPDVLRGITLAVTEINARGGLNGCAVRLKIQDDQGTVEGALAAARDMCNDPRVLAVIGPTTEEALAAVQRNYEFFGVLLISPTLASVTSKDRISPLFLENGVASERYAENIAMFALRQDWRRVGLIFPKTPYGVRLARHLQKELQDMDCRVVWEDEIANTPEPSFPECALAGRCGDIRFDALIAHTEHPLPRAVVERKNTETPILAAAAPAALNGQLPELRDKNVYTPDFTPKTPEYQQFYSTYKARYKAPPSNGAAFGYDSVMLLSLASQHAGAIHPAVMGETLLDFPKIESLTNTTGFTPRGVARKGVFSFSKE